MKHFLTFGTKSNDFEELKNAVSKTFTIELEEHESSWSGIYALEKNKLTEGIKLYPNFVTGEGFHEKDHDLAYLLEVITESAVADIKLQVEKMDKGFMLIRDEV